MNRNTFKNVETKFGDKNMCSKKRLNRFNNNNKFESFLLCFYDIN